MTTYRLAVAGRYAERHAIAEMLKYAQLDWLPVEITASWLTCGEACDAELTDAQAVEQVETNTGEIMCADALLYVPSWYTVPSDDSVGIPRWSPGRLIDFGMAMGFMIPIIVVGQPEHTIYQRGELVTVCAWGTLRETIARVLKF